MEFQETTPLKWPDGWPRTRFQDRKPQAAWKKSYKDSVELLKKELTRLGVTAVLLTRNELTSQDSGVAVFFSLKPINDYAWQEALGFIGEVPTMQQIDRAYMERVRKIHPDGPTPDRVMFDTLTKHRDRARAWARGEQIVEHEKVIPCDVFKEQRLNLNAIRLVISAIRQMERCGNPVMMDRAFRGFNKGLISAGAPNVEEVAS